MFKPPRSMHVLVEQVAELRLAGFTWDQIAQKLDRSPEAIRRWPFKYRLFWEQICERIRRETIDGAGAEGLTVLRQLLRSEDENVRKDAAKKLIDFRTESAPTPTVSSTPPKSDLAYIADYLGSLSDDQRRQLLEQAIARRTAGAPDAPVGPDGGGSA